MKSKPENIRKFNLSNRIARAQSAKAVNNRWTVNLPDNEYSWGNSIERLAVIRKGLPHDMVGVISKMADLPAKQILNHLGIAQSNFNKKMRNRDSLNVRDSEIMLLLFELLEFGTKVFNQETEKFHRWLKKSNNSLGDNPPSSFFYSVTGIQEVKNTLSKLEYGIMA